MNALVAKYSGAQFKNDDLILQKAFYISKLLLVVGQDNI